MYEEEYVTVVEEGCVGGMSGETRWCGETNLKKGFSFSFSFMFFRFFLTKFLTKVFFSKLSFFWF